MRRLNIREAFDLQDSLQMQQRQQESQDQARANAQTLVARAFPQNNVSPGFAESLGSAVLRLERCREADTDEYGAENPRPLTQTTLAMGVHESVEHLPQRPGAFEISPEGRTDEHGRPLHYWDHELGAWMPIVYDT